MKKLESLKKTIFLFLLTVLFATSGLYAQANYSISEAEEENYVESRRPPAFRDNFFDRGRRFYQPYRSRTLKEGSSNEIHIDAGVYGASVYIDGSYKGTSPLTLKALPEGSHTLKVSKQHYETREVSIFVKEANEEWYYLETEKLSGVVTFYTEPSYATVSLSGSNDSASTSGSGAKSLEVDEGTYTFTIKSFGYYETYGTIKVYRRTKRSITATLDACPFEIKYLTCDQEEFNPMAGGKFSKVNFTIGVTAPASGIFEILDSDGNCLYKESVNFTTWNTYLEWKGKDSYGNYLADGDYTAVITAQDFSQSCDIKINSSLLFQHMKITPDGSGIGAVASAELYPAETVDFQFSLGTFYPETENLVSGIKFNAGLLWAITDHFEFAMSGGCINDGQLLGNGAISFKGGSKVQLESSTFYWALNARWGFSSQPIQSPFGADWGTGIGLGGEIGFTNKKMYFGFQSEYIFCSMTCLGMGKDPNLWKNAFLFQYTGRILSFSAYAALNTGFGDYEITAGDNYYFGTINHLLQSVQVGTNISLFLGQSSWTLDLGCDAVIYPSEGLVKSNANLGFSLLI